MLKACLAAPADSLHLTMPNRRGCLSHFHSNSLMQSQGRKCHLFSSSKRTLPPDMHHRPRRRHKIRLANMVTLFLPSDNAANECNQLFVRSTPEHQFVQIVIPNGKKTGPNLAIGSN